MHRDKCSVRKCMAWRTIAKSTYSCDYHPGQEIEHHLYPRIPLLPSPSWYLLHSYPKTIVALTSITLMPLPSHTHRLTTISLGPSYRSVHTCNVLSARFQRKATDKESPPPNQRKVTSWRKGQCQLSSASPPRKRNSIKETEECLPCHLCVSAHLAWMTWLEPLSGALECIELFYFWSILTVKWEINQKGSTEINIKALCLQ